MLPTDYYDILKEEYKKNIILSSKKKPKNITKIEMGNLERIAHIKAMSNIAYVSSWDKSAAIYYLEKIKNELSDNNIYMKNQRKWWKQKLCRLINE